MSITEESCEELWNESVCNKSWADLVEEEECLNNLKNRNIVKNYPKKVNEAGKISNIKEPLVDENACEIPAIETKSIIVPKIDILPNFSVSHVKRDTEYKSPRKENLEPVKDFLQDDLSLTTHLNGFQLISPCKVEQKTPTKNIGWVNKNDQSGSRSDKNTKRKLTSVEDTKSDDLLQPSPSKIRRSNISSMNRTPTPKKTPLDKYTRKRSREITPGKSSEKKNPPRELESDPEVLARRQKQIDYGKNTIGYERYCQLVPKDSRGKMYPKTPPMHLKFSRRAWDGLIKVWRQRLHFWDPPSEGGGNPECLEIPSDLSDVSSTDGSLPNTPVQDKKRLRSKRSSSGSYINKDRFEAMGNSHHDEDNEDDGCTPLPSSGNK